MKEMFLWVLIGTLIIFSITTLLVATGLGARLGEDPDVLFVIQVVTIVVSIAAAAGLLVLHGPSKAS